MPSKPQKIHFLSDHPRLPICKTRTWMLESTKEIEEVNCLFCVDIIKKLIIKKEH